jgi:hypothetical protein
MKASEVVARAAACVAQGAKYKLGKGGMNPASAVPWTSLGECDCSGFAAWCLGVSRMTDNPWYETQNGGWLETSAIVRDCGTEFGFFAKVAWEDAEPGMLVVYGDRKTESGKTIQGHVGVISRVDASGPTRAIHCSSGNFRNTGDAIRETGIELWANRGGIVARCAFVT